MYGSDPGVLCLSRLSNASWQRGRLDRRRIHLIEMLALAEDLGHFFTLTSALNLAALLRLWRREPQLAYEHASQSFEISEQQDYRFTYAWSRMLRGQALFDLGQGEKGMAELVRRLVKSLPDRVELRLEAPVSEVTRREGRFQVQVKGAREAFDTVILATPASSSAPLVSSAFPEIAEILQGVPYVSAVIVAFGYDQEVLAGRTGTGFLVPPSEGRTMSACTWVNHKFPGRCPEGHALLRCFIGGKEAGQWMSCDDEELVDRIRSELKAILAVTVQLVNRGLAFTPRVLLHDLLHRVVRVGLLGRLLLLGRLPLLVPPLRLRLLAAVAARLRLGRLLRRRRSRSRAARLDEPA